MKHNEHWNETIALVKPRGNSELTGAIQSTRSETCLFPIFVPAIRFAGQSEVILAIEFKRSWSLTRVGNDACQFLGAVQPEGEPRRMRGDRMTRTRRPIWGLSPGFSCRSMA